VLSQHWDLQPQKFIIQLQFFKSQDHLARENFDLTFADWLQLLAMRKQKIWEVQLENKTTRHFYYFFISKKFCVFSCKFLCENKFWGEIQSPGKLNFWRLNKIKDLKRDLWSWGFPKSFTQNISENFHTLEFYWDFQSIFKISCVARVKMTLENFHLTKLKDVEE